MLSKSTKSRQLETGTAMTKPQDQITKSPPIRNADSPGETLARKYRHTAHTVMPPPLNRFRPSHDNRSK
jgi:hypothetical protein